MNLDLAAALAYARRHALHALAVTHDGELAAEWYEGGFSAADPHALYSGTKSFWGVVAAAAQADGLLALDERVAETLPAWDDDAWKARVTLRALLDMTSGIGFGGLGRAVPTYEAATRVELAREPGTAFVYSGTPFQVFGAVLARKLAPARDPWTYLEERILRPLGVEVAAWRRLADGNITLPTGAQLTARMWLRFGRLIACEGAPGGTPLIPRAELEPVWTPGTLEPRYGLGVWLAALADGTPVVYATGSGGQSLYCIPRRATVIVHFGAGKSFNHQTFLRRLG